MNTKMQNVRTGQLRDVVFCAASSASVGGRNVIMSRAQTDRIFISCFSGLIKF